MPSNIYTEIEKEYEKKRQIAIDNANYKKKKIYESNPKLQELEFEKNMLALKITKTILLSDSLTKQIEEENMNSKIQEIEKKITKQLEKLGHSKSDFEPIYECNICKDTGKISEDGTVKYCSCFIQKIINEMYKQYNMSSLNEENFYTFDYSFYSDVPNKEKYGIDRSPLDNIKWVRKMSEDFVKNINNSSQKNLLFVGNTGLGKTFLANCIANELIKKGKTVIYQTAPLLMDKVMDYKFNFEKKNSENNMYNRLFDVDLLIIDDLGTETMSNTKFTELFNIINTRLLENKKMIISTNLNLKELYNFYDERVVSRILGNFIACKFIGEDIRIKKRRLG